MIDVLSLPFDQYQRYRLTADILGEIRACASGPLRVLDVGGRTAILRAFLPSRPHAFFTLLEERAPANWRGRRWRTWLTAWLCTAVQSLGRIHGLLAKEGRR